MKKAILVGVNVNNNENFEDQMKELKGLGKAMGFKIEGSLTQNLKAINKKYYIGVGKVEPLKLLIGSHEADIVICKDELSPMQYKNLEDALGIEVLDRTLLILNIFASRAKSREAKLQVEVARLNYLLPRLTDNDQDYEQQSGGGVHNRGAGEKQIDIDRRILRNKIAELEKELDELEKNKANQRKKRVKNPIPLVSIVGYTNAGKSTLMNAFIEEYNKGGAMEKEVFAKDMLFATLDTTTRYIKFKDNKEILLSDTVGFISDLPTGLIRAFRSTLEEIVHADLILLVCDISSSEVINHIDVTMQTLEEIGVREDIPIIYVFNKADKLGLATMPTADNKIFISAKNHLNLNLVENEIKKVLYSDWKKCKMYIPYESYGVLSYLISHANVMKKFDQENGIMIEVELSPMDFNKFIDYVWIDKAS